MAKINLPEVGSGYNVTTINANFQKIKEALNNGALWRNNPEGEPNQLLSNIDANGMRIYNLPIPVLDHEPARFKEVKEAVAFSEANLVQAIIAKNQAQIAALQAQGFASEVEEQIALAIAIGNSIAGNDYYRFGTKAQALAGGTVDGEYVEVFIDESQNGQHTIYENVSGALVLRINLNSFQNLLASPVGADNIGIGGVTLSAYLGNSVDKIVNNVAALRAVDKTKNARIKTLGYYSVGDFGDASYRLDLADTTSTDNGATVIVGVDGGRWKLLQSDVINVRQYGVVGNGIADDTAKVQLALNSGFKNVVVKGNCFLRITSTLIIADGVSFAGCANMVETTWKPADPSGNDGGKPDLAQLQGTWLFADVPVDQPAIKLLGGKSSYGGFAHYYPGNTVDLWVAGPDVGSNGETIYEPVPFAPTVWVENTSASLNDLLFVNCFRSVYIQSAQDIQFDNLWIANLDKGIYVNELGAGGRVDNTYLYPMWSQAYGFAGLMNRVNVYADNKGQGAKLGNDDGVTRTIEQIQFKGFNLIGCADGIIFSGKGSTVTGYKIDNCKRCFTVLEDNASSNHQILDGWANSFYGYTPVTRAGNDFWLVKNLGGGQLTVNNLLSLRSDGHGIWLAVGVNRTSVINALIYNNAFVGMTVAPGSRYFVDGVYVVARGPLNIPYRIADVDNSTFVNLTTDATSNIALEKTGPTAFENMQNVVFDCPLLGVSTIAPNGLGRTGSYFRYVQGNDRFSAAPHEGYIVNLANTGGSPSRVEYSAANLNTSGDGAGAAIVRTSAGGNMTSITSSSVAGLLPVFNAAFPLGSPSQVWAGVYTNAAPTVVSDARLKTKVKSLSEKEKAAGKVIRKAIGTWKWLEKVESEGKDARIHVGPTVQEVIRIMEENGLDAMRYSFVGYDVIEAQDEVKDENGSVIVPGREAGDIYTLKAQELLMFIVGSLD